MSKRAIYLVPLSVFLVMAVYFAIGLTKDPKIIPSALIDKLIPEFSLPPIDNGTPQGYGKGFSSADFKAGGIWFSKISPFKGPTYLKRILPMPSTTKVSGIP